MDIKFWRKCFLCNDSEDTDREHGRDSKYYHYDCLISALDDCKNYSTDDLEECLDILNILKKKRERRGEIMNECAEKYKETVA